MYPYLRVEFPVVFIIDLLLPQATYIPQKTFSTSTFTSLLKDKSPSPPSHHTSHLDHPSSLYFHFKIGLSASNPARAMAWRCSGATNEALVDNMAQHGLITSSRVMKAMKGVDRAHYAPAEPYQDSPQPIGHRATISAPHMHAAAAESLLPYLKPGARVLDVGSGSGYLTHVLAELVKPRGKVVGVEHIQPLVELGVGNTRKSAEGRELMDQGGIRYVKGDGREGWVEGGPYDAIHVGAAAKGFQQKLVDQLKAPGRLFIPVEEKDLQHIYVIDKAEDGTVTRKKDMGVRYVPLTDAPAD